MTRILFYAHDFAPSVGGVETVVMSLAQGLCQQTGEPAGEPLRVTVATQTAANGFDDAALPFQVVRRPGLVRLARLLREADIAHLAGPCLLPMLFGLLLRKPVVVEHHGFQTVCPNGQMHYQLTRSLCPGHFMARRHRQCLRCNAPRGPLRSFVMWLLTFPRRWLCRRVALNITPTRWLETLLELPHTITVQHGVPDEAEVMAGETPRSPLTFAFAGRLVSTKGIHVLLEAAQRLKAKGLAFQLRIIGDGPERSRLEAHAATLQLNGCVKFLGFLPRPKLEEVLREAAAIVMPSLGGEVFGLVAAENMMRGHLVIASDLGALTEVVGDAGLSFPPGDAAELAAQMEKIVESPCLASHFGRRARERSVDLFRLGRMLTEHLSLYRTLLGERHHPC